jgi:hypothetical protein
MVVRLFGGLNTAEKPVVSKQKSGRWSDQGSRVLATKNTKMIFLPAGHFPRAYRRLESFICCRGFVFFVAKMVRDRIGLMPGKSINLHPCR